MRLLFTTAPLPGHFHPLVPLAWAARAVGHEVLFATTEDFAPTVAGAGLPVVAWAPPTDVVALVREESERDGTGRHGSAGRRLAHGRAFARVAERCLDGAPAVLDAWRPHLVVSERAESAGPLAAAERGLPLVEFHWGAAELPEYRQGAAQWFGRALPDPDEVLTPWPTRLRRPYAAGFRSVRNIDYNGEAHVPTWALRPAERPRVCVTFGTLLPRLADLPLRASITPVLRRLAALDHEILIATDPATAAAWPELAECAAHVGRMPLAQLLPACELLVSHGGQGTVLTALGAGCPQLLLPQFDDQFDNAEAVETAGAGRRLTPDRISPDAVLDQVTALLDDEVCAKNAALIAEEMATQPSLHETVGLLAELAARR
ncbi:nucleotide disphospho-sugar-binding domain-containing protein [Streptomyces sp. NPDC003077]|uniref:glycosyltransferase n=1 Tax=Streptomyces sp. NPDC003077 TaxID=3154443 RepID=UPI0033B50DA2